MTYNTISAHQENLSHLSMANTSFLIIDHDAMKKSENFPSSLSINDRGIDQISIEISDDIVLPLVLSIRTICTLHIVLKNKARAHLVVENHASSQINMQLEKEALLQLYFIPHYNHHRDTTQSLSARIEEASRLGIFELAMAEEQCSRTIQVEMCGPLAHTRYFGIDQLHGHAKKDSRLTIFHRAPKTISEQSFRGTYAGSAHGFFLGKVIVDKDAWLSNAKQLYKSIILSEHAKASVMPQLEINNSDISASHGASIGKLDDDCLFYLCARGFSLKDAHVILIKSLFNDILEHIDEPTLKNMLTAMVERSIEHSFSVPL
jgi:Fe-S cluster assembly scaffold protein SufB